MSTERTLNADLLRAALEIVDLAEMSFEHHGEMNTEDDPSCILREALRCASDDIVFLELLGASTDGVNPPMFGRRAELRIGLALKIFEFRERHGGNARRNFLDRMDPREPDNSDDGADGEAVNGASHSAEVAQ